MPKAELSAEAKKAVRTSKIATNKFIRGNAVSLQGAINKKGAATAAPLGRPRVQRLPFCGKNAVLETKLNTWKKGPKAGKKYTRVQCVDPDTADKHAAKPKATVAAPKPKSTTAAPKPKSTASLLGKPASVSMKKSAPAKRASATEPAKRTSVKEAPKAAVTPSKGAVTVDKLAGSSIVKADLEAFAKKHYKEKFEALKAKNDKYTKKDLAKLFSAAHRREVYESK